MTRHAIITLLAGFVVMALQATPPAVVITSPAVSPLGLTSGSGLMLSATVTPGDGNPVCRIYGQGRGLQPQILQVKLYPRKTDAWVENPARRVA